MSKRGRDSDSASGDEGPAPKALKVSLSAPRQPVDSASSAAETPDANQDSQGTRLKLRLKVDDAAAPASAGSSSGKRVRKVPTQELVERLIKLAVGKDRYKLYVDPVRKSEVPDYYDVITQPMFLATMQEKVTKRVYRSVREFASDFALVIANAKTYNPPDNPYHQEAVKLSKAMADALTNALARDAGPDHRTVGPASVSDSQAAVEETIQSPPTDKPLPPRPTLERGPLDPVLQPGTTTNQVVPSPFVAQRPDVLQDPDLETLRGFPFVTAKRTYGARSNAAPSFAAMYPAPAEARAEEHYSAERCQDYLDSLRAFFDPVPGSKAAAMLDKTVNQLLYGQDTVPDVIPDLPPSPELVSQQQQQQQQQQGAAQAQQHALQQSNVTADPSAAARHQEQLRAAATKQQEEQRQRQQAAQQHQQQVLSKQQQQLSSQARMMQQREQMLEHYRQARQASEAAAAAAAETSAGHGARALQQANSEAAVRALSSPVNSNIALASPSTTGQQGSAESVSESLRYNARLIDEIAGVLRQEREHGGSLSTNDKQKRLRNLQAPVKHIQHLNKAKAQGQLSAEQAAQVDEQAKMLHQALAALAGTTTPASVARGIAPVPTATSSTSAAPVVGANVHATPPTQRCFNCATATSTTWHPGPSSPGGRGTVLCDPCGVYWSQHHPQHRPKHLWSVDPVASNALSAQHQLNNPTLAPQQQQRQQPGQGAQSAASQ